MSAMTDALTYHLHCDLEGHLDAYQLSRVGDGELWPDATLRQAQAWMLAGSLFKKYNDGDRPSAGACKAALQEFLACNDRNATFQCQPLDIRDEELINGVAVELHDFWYDKQRNEPVAQSYNQLWFAGRAGPGASTRARANDFYTKMFDSPLAATTDTLLFLWEKLTSQDPRFSSAEKVRSQRYGSTLVEGNKLSFVNKNVTIARGICTEPAINMWFQLGLGVLIERRLKSFYGLQISRGRSGVAVQQDVNRAMARIGSANGRFATIDLKSASDTIAMSLAERVFPAGSMMWYRALRSPTTVLPDGSTIELHALSTMGNGFTFPMMTMLFAAVVSVAYKHLGIPLRGHGPADLRTFAVFGDDIIVDQRAYRLVCRILDLLGFTVNDGKSFVEGPFRESCGGDYYDGHPCRGVYIKRLSTSQDFAVAINSLNRWSAITGISLPSLVGRLYQYARRSRMGVVFCPPDENDDAGVHVPLDMARGVKHLPHGLHEYSRFVPRPSKYSFSLGSGDEDGIVEFLPVGGTVVRQINPLGLHLSALYGALRGSTNREKNLLTATIQADRVKYLTKRRVSASWDTLPATRRDHLGWRHWSSAVRDNLPGCVG